MADVTHSCGQDKALGDFGTGFWLIGQPNDMTLNFRVRHMYWPKALPPANRTACTRRSRPRQQWVEWVSRLCLLTPNGLAMVLFAAFNTNGSGVMTMEGACRSNRDGDLPGLGWFVMLQRHAHRSPRVVLPMLMSRITSHGACATRRSKQALEASAACGWRASGTLC